MVSVTKPLLFYSRCKPHSIDAQRVAIDHHCVFFGYQLGRERAYYTPEDPNGFLVSPAAPDSEWRAHFKPGRREARQHSRNRNFVASIGQGSIALVPRPSEGLIYAGYIAGDFRVNYDASRYAAALKIFEAHGKPDDDKIRLSGELAQGWDVESWTPLPMPVVPGWIRSSLFGRSTYCAIGASNGHEDPLELVARLMRMRQEGRSFEVRDWTLDPAEVRRRLFDALTPNLFEGLMISLLQLEQPSLAWLGVGGSGDGGIDGIASDDGGNVVALLQCKWIWRGEQVFTEPNVWTDLAQPTRYFAYMAGPKPDKAGADQVLGPAEIVDLVVRHATRLPLAMGLRIGERAWTSAPQTQGGAAVQLA